METSSNTTSWFSVGFIKDDPLRQRPRRKRSKPNQIHTRDSFNIDLHHFLRHCGQIKAERRSSLKRSRAVVYLVCAAKHSIRSGWHRLPPCTIEGLWGLSKRAAWQALRDLERSGAIETRLVDHHEKTGETITEVRIPAREDGKDRLPIPFWFVESTLPQIQTPNQLIVALSMIGWISAGHSRSFTTAELLERTELTKHALARAFQSSAFRKIKHGEWAINKRRDTSANLVTLPDSQRGPQVGKVTRFADTTGSSVLVGTLGSLGSTEEKLRFSSRAEARGTSSVVPPQSAGEKTGDQGPLGEISPDGDLSAEHTGASSGKKTFAARGGAAGRVSADHVGRVRDWLRDVRVRDAQSGEIVHPLADEIRVDLRQQLQRIADHHSGVLIDDWIEDLLWYLRRHLEQEVERGELEAIHVGWAINWIAEYQFDRWRNWFGEEAA